jgi:hypothetical protein
MTNLDSLQDFAAYYRAKADTCHGMAQQAHRMAQRAPEPFSRDWLDLAEKWAKLARQAEAGTLLTRTTP